MHAVLMPLIQSGSSLKNPWISRLEVLEIKIWIYSKFYMFIKEFCIKISLLYRNETSWAEHENKGKYYHRELCHKNSFFFFWLFFLGGVFFLTISINDKWTYVYMHVKTFFCEYCLNKIYKNGLSACSNQREKRQSVVIIVNKYSNVEIRWFSVCFINDLICF